jgi:hypothetical protein
MRIEMLSQIEAEITRLTKDEQLWLLKRLARHLRQENQTEADFLDDQIAEMAKDPDIQREIRAINEEFAVTDNDGLS